MSFIFSLNRSGRKSPKQKREEEYEAQEIRRYLVKSYTDQEITKMLNISMSKLMHYKKILGEEARKHYAPENAPKRVSSAVIEFKERMFSLIRINKEEILSKTKIISTSDQLRIEKLNRKIFVQMIKELADIKTDLNLHVKKDSELEEEFRKTIAHVKQLLNSKIDTMNESDIDKTIEDWLTEEEFNYKSTIAGKSNEC
jgi:hypothetical protein